MWLWGSGKANLGAGESQHVSSTPRCLEASFGCKAMKISMGTNFAFVIDEQMRTWYWGANSKNPKYNAIVPTLHPDFIGQRMAVRARWGSCFI